MQPSQVHRLWLDDFWAELGGNKNTGYKISQRKKLSQLKRLSQVVIDNKHSKEKLRNVFNCVKYKRHSLNTHPKCFVCFGLADVRHHIILIKNGGINNKRNLVSLCNDCHAKIHPWLQRGA